MKKILSVLCVLAVVASFACIGVSADDVAATFSVVAANPVEGATEFTADVIATIPEGGDVTQLGLLVTVPEGLTLKACEQAVSFGSFVTSETTDTNPYMILWVSGTKSLPAGDTAIATLTFEVPADAAVDTSWDIALELEPDNLPASVAGDEYTAEQIAVVGATVVVEAVPVITTTSETETSETETSATETEPTETESATEPEASETETSATESETETETTKAPVSNNPQTGDMAFVVVAVMVVALGAAVVVKKVSVR